MSDDTVVVASPEARYHKGANAESAAGGHLVVQKATGDSGDTTGTPSAVIPIQDGREMEKSQNGLGIGEPGDPMYTLDTTGAQAVAYPAPVWWNGTQLADTLTTTSNAQTMPDKGRLQAVVQVALPCNVDGAQIAPTLRGFGHGWQGQHNTTNAVAQAINGDVAGTLDANYGKGPGERTGVERDVVVQSTWGYDEYNDAISEELHHSLRAGTRQSNGVLQLFEPMSLREENWAGRDVKNALRAEASRSSHAVVDRPEPFALLNFQGAKSQNVVNDGSVSFTLNAMHGHDMHVVGYQTTTPTETIMEPASNLVVRRLTPLECELLMGWEPNWTAEGVNEDGTVVKMADTHRYRMCGNGVVANVGHWIAARYVEARLAAEAEGE